VHTLGNDTGLGYQHFLLHDENFKTLRWICPDQDGLNTDLHGSLYNWFNIRTRSPLHLIPNSKRERTVVVTILAKECTLNLDLIPKVN